MAKTAFITGASSGIGRALALELAGRGWDLGLAARRVQALEELKAEIRARAGSSERRVGIRGLDVTDTGAVRVVMQELAGELGGLDMVVANAGVALNHKIGSPGFERDEQTIHTNLLGAMATVDAAAEMFRGTGGGHIVALSSVAAYRGMPGLGAYSASKAALLKYCEAARVELRSRGTRVTTLLPGYIDTPLNQDMSSRPFLVSAEVGAASIVNLIERGVATSTVPVMPWTVLGLLLRAVPDFLWDRMLGGPRRG